MDSQTVEGRAHHQPRLEDDPLVRGLGRFAADVPMTGQAQAYFVRSPHAFADIRSIDTAAAKAVPGVVACSPPPTWRAIGNVSQHPPLAGRGGRKLIVPHRPALAGETVRHVGEPVAVVVAETLIAAQDAAELVAVDYEERDAGGRPARGRCARARRRSGRRLPATSRSTGPAWRPDPDANASEVERIIASAAHVARVSVVHQSIMVPSMEPRGATASYDPADEATTCAAARRARARCATDWLPSWASRTKLRVITEDVGGAFGLKTGPYPEYLAILVAARRSAGPVHWMSNRAEAFLSDNHARDAFSDVELALDERGKFLALRVRTSATWAPISAPSAPTSRPSIRALLPGMYDIPRIDMGGAACSPTRRRPRPTAAPDGRRRTSSSNASLTRPRASRASIR